MYALRLFGAARVAAFCATAPFIGAMAAMPILGERWQLNHFGAATLMAVGLYVLLTEHHRHMHFHVEMVHEQVHTHADPHRVHHHEEEVTEAQTHTGMFLFIMIMRMCRTYITGMSIRQFL